MALALAVRSAAGSSSPNPFLNTAPAAGGGFGNGYRSQFATGVRPSTGLNIHIGRLTRRRKPWERN